MSRRNWMPLYIPDFLADTMHLSAAETGAYLCLIMDYWMHDGLPDDDRKLAQIARVPIRAWLAMRATIAAFFHDGWQHKRIDAELMKMIGMTERRRAAGSKGGTVSSIVRSRQANVQQTFKQNPSKRPSKNEANVQHSTQEDITSTFSGAARARDQEPENPDNSTTAEPPQSGSAMDPVSKPGIPVTSELAATIQKKRWVNPC